MGGLITQKERRFIVRGKVRVLAVNPAQRCLISHDPYIDSMQDFDEMNRTGVEIVDWQRPAQTVNRVRFSSAASQWEIMTTQFSIRDIFPEECETFGNLLVEVYSQLDGFSTPEDQPFYYQLLKNIG